MLKGTYKNCEVCKNKFYVFPHVKERARFCSKFCRAIGVARAKKTTGHFHWKGDKASYSAKHKWMNNNFGRPGLCEHCGKDNLKGREIHWANISGNYKRQRNDWLRLCRDCHWEYDRRKKWR